ncbi:MAG: tol-pal system protein YbgF [Desulfuromonadales bacterium C00003094]|jgi:tol-pal system protein YbgF|nr:MAG: tol-pal system protein YbgF [Desulfuromonadales bacterium C00003094]OEU72672.1 MAG: tol-pal system protein YbgF [Desulfuromonadales bacterium C00003107]
MRFDLHFMAILLAGAFLGGCAVPANNPNSSRALKDIARLNSTQQQQDQRIDQLLQQLQLLETRLDKQQAATDKLEQIAAEKGTTGWQKTESTTPTNPSTVPQGSPTELYLQAFADYAAGRYQPAIQGFNAFIDNYPGNDYAGNAQYWLGECYYALEDYQQAVVEFEKAATQYPESGKAPEALLKMVPALRRVNQFEQAREALQLLLRRYPDSPAAARAKAGS